ncbi:MAG: alpha/beta hydrolase [Pigmentiphaga sp.]
MPSSHTEAAVFMNYTQRDLDDRVFNTQLHPPFLDDIISEFSERSAAAESALKRQAFSYGAHPDQVVDFFPTQHKDAPTFIFIHGGAWHKYSRKFGAFLAPAFINHGINFAALGFSLLPAARLPEIVRQVREGIAFVYHNTSQGGSSPEIYLSGHSSGAHLAALALCTDWSTHRLSNQFIKGGLCISGLYDLRPVILSKNFPSLQISENEEKDLTPLNLASKMIAGVTLAYAENDPIEAPRQARDFHAALLAQGKSSQLVEVPDCNHWSILRSLADPQGTLFQCAQSLINN